MKNVLTNKQMRKLDKILKSKLIHTNELCNKDKVDYCDIFIHAKYVEGCSKKSMDYYKSTILNMLKIIDKSVENIETNDLRDYLSQYKKINNCKKMTMDNIRRILSSFFSWLENEQFITQNPIRRIHKIKTETIIKETFIDENLVTIKENCTEIRDVAIIDMLNSTGMRIGEFVKLNISDINFNERECIVLGKGDKQRKVYFDASTKIHLKKIY